MLKDWCCPLIYFSKPTVSKIEQKVQIMTTNLGIPMFLQSNAWLQREHVYSLTCYLSVCFVDQLISHESSGKLLCIYTE